MKLGTHSENDIAINIFMSAMYPKLISCINN